MKVLDLAKGVVLQDRFRLVEIVGRGSFGDVWLAEVVDGSELPRRVALKVYQQAPQTRARKILLKEADIARTFHHQRLVRVFGTDRLDGLFVMWTEYVDGPSLHERKNDCYTP